MKNTIRKITALTLAVMTIGACTACGKEKPEDINDSQESAEDNQQSGITTITMGMPGTNMLIMPYITGFNDYCKEKGLGYELEIVNYSKMVDDDDSDGTKAVNALKMDMATDNTPDIVVLAPMYMAELLQKGVFADMYSLMDTCGGVTREDFMPNVLEGLEFEGELPTITYSYRIRTAAAKTKFVGEDAENWTPQQAMEAYTEYSDEMDFMGLLDQGINPFAEYMLEKASRSCIDFTTYTCDFMRDEFVSLLDFAYNNPYKGQESPDFAGMSANDSDIWFREWEMRYMKDEALVSQVTISSMGQELGNALYSAFAGEDITFVGYPSEDGRGALTDTDWMFGISELSQNKEAAWQFILYMLSDEVQGSFFDVSGGIPVIKKHLDAQRNYKDKEDHRSIYYNLYVPGNFEREMYITEEAVQKYYDYILNVKFEPYRDYRIDFMIDEECAAAISGEKTAQEVAEILDSRISIYLAERQ